MRFSLLQTVSYGLESAALWNGPETAKSGFNSFKAGVRTDPSVARMLTCTYTDHALWE